MIRSRRLCGLWALFCALLVVGCGDGGTGSGPSGWTVDEGALTLERDLLVSETDVFYFGSIADVTPASDGRILVADAESNHIKVLGADGSLQDTMGRGGQGPGEFERLRDVAVSRGDSIFALDSGQRRISVFGPSGEFVYTVPASLGQGFPQQLIIPSERPGFVLEHMLPTFSTTDNRGTDVVQRVDAAGTIVDSILALARSPTHQISQGGAQVILPIPFTPSNHVALGPQDRLHVSRGDSLKVVQYALDGSVADTVVVPFDPVPVTSEEKAQMRDEYGQDRTVPTSKMPDTKPAVEKLLVDDEGQYWFGRPTAHEDTTEWWVVRPEAKRVATTRLPTDINLTAVRDGHTYGITSTEAGAPAVVRYRVRITPQGQDS